MKIKKNCKASVEFPLKYLVYQINKYEITSLSISIPIIIIWSSILLKLQIFFFKNKNEWISDEIKYKNNNHSIVRQPTARLK